MKKISCKIYSLGCKANQYDSGTLSGFLQSAGFLLAEEKADIAIVNTCVVTQSAVAKNKGVINKARRENPQAKIVVIGCWPKVFEKDFEKEVKADLIWKNNDYKKLIKALEKIIPKFSKNISCLNKNFQARNQNRSRYFLKVQDGCEQFCSYCIIPLARGKLQSRLLKEVLEEAELAVENGYEEIVLTGIHLGLYGINNLNKKKQERGVNLVYLLKQLAKIKKLKKIRLSSIEITEVNDELIAFMKKEPKMCRHLHLPLQAGCDKILRLMKRPYNLKYFSARVEKIRQAMPKISLSTDVIVGFPGETKNDFKDAYNFCQKIKFSRLHVFSFSLHKKAPAFKFPDRVEPSEIKKRSQQLRSLSDKLSIAYEKKFIGKKLEVIVEKNPGQKKMKGKTEYYFDVFFDQQDILDLNDNVKKDLIGKVVKVKIK
jgi:threonylcarbamoyladenosine tRNA methylthiotransferase MtaB